MKIKIGIATPFIMMGILCTPLLLNCIWALPASDDFSNYSKCLLFGGSVLKYIPYCVYENYVNWQGTYLGAALASVPIFFCFGIVFLRVAYLISVLLFIFSIVDLLYRILVLFLGGVGHTRNGRYIVLGIVSFFALLYIFNGQLDELFYWWTAVAVYTIPLTFAVFSVSMLFRFYYKKKHVELFFSVLFALMGAGGALDISVLLCLMLIGGALLIYLSKKEYFASIIVIASSILGTIINVCAPGNFVRHGNYANGYDLIECLKYTVSDVSIELYAGMVCGLIPLLIVSVITLTIKYMCNTYSQDISFKQVCFATVYCLFAIYFVNFPVYLGYHRSYLNARSYFVERVTIGLFLVVLCIVWGVWMSRFSRRILKLSMIILFYVFCWSSIFFVQTTNEYEPIRMMVSILNGTTPRVSKRELDILEAIEHYTEREVYLSYTVPVDEWTGIKTIGLTDDVTNWVNVSVSYIYNKDCVSVKYCDENNIED